MQVLDCVELDPRGPIERTIIWLHGLGASGHDFPPIVPELGLPDELGVRFVFPHAPRRPVTINGGFAMPAWYDIYELSDEAEQDASGIAESRAAIDRLIDREIEAGVRAQGIVLAGFSQGGALALDTALRSARNLAGVMALSTWLALADEISDLGPARDPATPIFMAHGTHDDIVRIDQAIRSRDRLRELGYHVDWADYPMAHGLCSDEIKDISRWLRRVLAN